MKVRKAVRQAIRDAGVKGMKKGEHVKARDPEYLERIRNGGSMSVKRSSPIKAVKNNLGNARVNKIVKSFNATSANEKAQKAIKQEQKNFANNVVNKKAPSLKSAPMKFKPGLKALALAGAGTAALIAGTAAAKRISRQRAKAKRQAHNNAQN